MTSSLEGVSTGAPQGSILVDRCCLCNLKTIDLLEVMSECDIFCTLTLQFCPVRRPKLTPLRKA